LNTGDGCNVDCLIEECVDGVTRACGTTDVGVCSYGNETCVNGIWSGHCNGVINPSAEICDSQDNDCDGETDEGCSSEFCDTDGDSYFSDSAFCGGSDCDDGNSSINPGIIENIFINCGDGIDNDCDGSDIICGGG
jgi:hypothetical protein